MSYGNRLSENKNGIDLTYHYTINNVLYGYDDLTNDICTDFTYDDNGNLTEIETYDYDTLTTTNVKTFTYDNFNRLVSYTDGSDTTTYSYYADNLRASKTDSNSNTTAFVWNGQNLAYEKTGTDWKAYSYDPTGIAAVKTSAEQKIYAKNPHSDVIGQISDTAGTLSGATDFTAFGELVSGNLSSFGYAGEYHDTESGYIYLRNRYYDPSIGRFITEDPAKDGTNWYVYCGNNPVNACDPTGLDIYYFVNTEFRKEADKDKKKLDKIYDEPVHVLETDSRDSFIEEWNMMGSWDGENVDVSLVVINMHGSPSSLSPYANGNKGRIYANDIEDGTLISKYIDNIIVLGCNSGHFDHRYSSLVNKMLVYNNVDSVIASDGTVKNRSLFGNYKSVGDSSFVNYLWLNKKYRDNYGYIKYTKNSAGELEWDILGNKVSIRSVLNKANIK